jgi:hypothetical protein
VLLVNKPSWLKVRLPQKVMLHHRFPLRCPISDTSHHKLSHDCPQPLILRFVARPQFRQGSATCPIKTPIRERLQDHNTGMKGETKTQHLLVVSPGNLFGGLRLSPFDDEFPDRRRGDTTLSAKNFHDSLSVDKGSLRYNPLLSTSACTSGIVQIYTHD